LGPNPIPAGRKGGHISGYTAKMTPALYKEEWR
jgi:hypothetical protein